MLAILKKRKYRKKLKESLHVAHHARNMREDIADAADLERLSAAEAEIQKFYDSNDGNPDEAIKQLLEVSDKVYPIKNMSGIRENVEVLIVAIGAAMAIRAFFFQPYKIPTGSMQPTLNGIIATAQAEPTLFQRQPFKFFNWLVTGESYKAVKAQIPGRLDGSLEFGADHVVFGLGGQKHRMPKYMFDAWVLHDNMTELQTSWRTEVQKQKLYTQGETIFGGQVVAGDHILVNKMKYNFSRPKRGDISVFDTRNIDHPEIRKDTFYIKRMVGMPGEKIQIQNNRIVANGNIVLDPPIFEEIGTSTNYVGHVNRRLLATEKDFIELTDSQYLMMGDNTESSMDGRYFGGVEQEAFQGPAFMVYWPFREHWGLVK